MCLISLPSLSYICFFVCEIAKTYKKKNGLKPVFYLRRVEAAVRALELVPENSRAATHEGGNHPNHQSVFHPSSCHWFLISSCPHDLMSSCQWFLMSSCQWLLMCSCQWFLMSSYLWFLISSWFQGFRLPRGWRDGGSEGFPDEAV